MDLLIYLNRRVYITLTNGFYYTGIVLSADQESLTLRDKQNNLVTLRADVIERITEVRQ